jgi:hypothetical protein
MSIEENEHEEHTKTQREFREYAKGKLDVDNQVHPIAGLGIPKDIREILMFMAESWKPPKHPNGNKVDDFPNSFWETKPANEMIRKYATNSATKALHEGNISQLSGIIGEPSYDNDISGLKSTEKLIDWLINSEKCKIIYCAAPPGRGKTDWSLLLLELIEHQYRVAQSMQDSDNIPTPEFATNFSADMPSHIDSKVNEFHNYDDFLEWAETGSSDDVRWFIFDEASTELTAQSGENAQKVAETFAPFTRKMRKKGINLLTIGHDRSDIHPAIRAVASYINKPSLKKVRIYEGIKNREPYGHVLTLDGAPETSLSYDTDDVAEWDWGEGIDDGPSESELADSDSHISESEWRKQRNDWMKAMYESSKDISYKDVGEIFGLSSEGARKALD